jgi:hypothetical protein
MHPKKETLVVLSADVATIPSLGLHTLIHGARNRDLWPHYHADSDPLSAFWKLQKQRANAIRACRFYLFFRNNGKHIHGCTAIDIKFIFIVHILHRNSQLEKTEMLSPVYHWAPDNTG